MKRIISLLILGFMLHTVTFAAPSIDNNNEKRTVDISGTSEIKDGYVSVTIVKKGEGISHTDFNNAILFYTVDTDENGSYMGQFTLPSEADTGAYLVYIGGDGEPGEFYYANKEEMEECIKAFCGADKDTIDGVLKKYSVEKNILGVSLEGDYKKYPAWSNRAMLEFIGEDAPESITDIIGYFDKANEAALLCMGDKEDTLKAFSSNKLENVIEEGIETDALAKMYVSVRGEMDIEKEGDITTLIADNIRKASAVVSVNSSTKGIMTEVLEKYNDVLSLDLDGYYTKASVKINKALTDKDFKTVEEIQNAFKKAVSDAKKSANSSGGSGGSGGSTGGGASSGVISFSPQPTVPEKEEVKISFNDIDGVLWAKDDIITLCEKGIVSGYGNDEFRPYNEVTRAEFTKLICSVGIKDGKSEIAFTDVKDSDWFKPYVEKAVALGIIKGAGDKFMPLSSVTREDAAVIIYRYLKDKITFSESKTFSDEESISDYAKEAVSALSGEGIINGMGNGNFAPKNTLTRAQAAVLINSVISKLQ